jgi:hypothetical protein
MEYGTSRCYECKICNKEYSSRQNLWKHNSKFHKNTNNQNDNHQEINNQNNNQNNNHDNHVNHEEIKVKKYNCAKCNKIFNNYQNRWRHEKKCKTDVKNEIQKKDEIIETLKLALEYQKELVKKQEEEMKEIKSLILKSMNKNCTRFL